MNKLILPILALSLPLVGCATAQLEASAVYVGAEVASAQLLTKHPAYLPIMVQLTSDWRKYQGGTLTATDEATLLQTIVTNTKGSLSPTQAALLDGATQQVLANVNTTAPTPMAGAAAAIISDLLNGVSREIVIYTTPAPSS